MVHFNYVVWEIFQRRSIDTEGASKLHAHTHTKSPREGEGAELHQITQRVDCQTTDPHSNNHMAKYR